MESKPKSTSPIDDPWMPIWWYCTTCNARLQRPKIKDHMAKTGHMDFLRDTFMEFLYPEELWPSFENMTPQRQAYQTLIKKMTLNLEAIASHKSMKELEDILVGEDAIIVGAGPTLYPPKQLEQLAASNFKGGILLTDRMLIPALKAGITPDKFNIFVNSLDDREVIPEFYNDDIVKTWAKDIKFLLAVNVHNNLVSKIEFMGGTIYWYHPMRDYKDGHRSFDRVFRLAFEARGQQRIPMISDGGNVASCCWFLANRVLKAKRIVLIGCPLSIKGDKKYEIDESDNIKKQMSQFDYYRVALYDLLERYPIVTYDCNEGGDLTSPRLKKMTLAEYLNGAM